MAHAGKGCRGKPDSNHEQRDNTYIYKPSRHILMDGTKQSGVDIFYTCPNCLTNVNKYRNVLILRYFAYESTRPAASSSQANGLT